MKKHATIIREPVAIGRFYPQNKDQVEKAVNDYFAQVPSSEKKSTPWAVLLPHAGYVYCGSVLAKTLKGLSLPETLLILCPNHTGRGKTFSVWPEGEWKTPIGNFLVDDTLVNTLVDETLFQRDYLAHLGEHSIEVLLPFLACTQEFGLPKLIPVCVGIQDTNMLMQAGAAIADFLSKTNAEGKKIGLVISSDMNHYESHDICMEKDQTALNAIAANDPVALLRVCTQNHITMCGVGPCALAMFAAQFLGKTLKSTLIAHTTSAEASGNYRQTVGYAGLHFFLE